MGIKTAMLYPPIHKNDPPLDDETTGFFPVYNQPGVYFLDQFLRKIFITIHPHRPIRVNRAIFQCPVKLNGMINKCILVNNGAQSFCQRTGSIGRKTVDDQDLIRYLFQILDTPDNMFLFIEGKDNYR
jgi:hypothetical protein